MSAKTSGGRPSHSGWKGNMILATITGPTKATTYMLTDPTPYDDKGISQQWLIWLLVVWLQQSITWISDENIHPSTISKRMRKLWVQKYNLNWSRKTKFYVFTTGILVKSLKLTSVYWVSTHLANLNLSMTWRHHMIFHSHYLPGSGKEERTMENPMPCQGFILQLISHKCCG